MPSAERLYDRGTRRGRYLSERFGRQVREIRIGLGLSQAALGRMLKLSRSAIGRMETAHAAPDLITAARVCAVLGMELSVGIHQLGAPARDIAHAQLLDRFAARLHPSIQFATEWPLPIPGDLRALDGLIQAPFRCLVEAETRASDAQAIERKVRLKQRDAGVERAILLLKDSRANRAFLAANPGLRRSFPLGTRAVLAALAAGRDPGADGIVFL
jgi:transcriptional regulator with XRE-family HTH domain